jgi:MoxR-like ATPase
VAKGELIELMATSAIAQEHLLIVGPPGTAKSELIKRFALYCRAGGENYFEYLLTRFTEPNEIFGPVNISAFREGAGMSRITDGMLPQAQIAFLDEVFKANSAILNAFLTILNERIFYNGSERKPVPLVFAVGATNAVPDDSDLAALYDRFLLRVWTDNVEESRFGELFRRGWELERNRIAGGYGVEEVNITTVDTLRQLYAALEEVDVSEVAGPYRTIIRQIRAEGIQLSDRRVIKLLKLIAASALRDKRMAAHPGDFWVLRHVWNDPEQIPHLQSIVDPYVTEYGGESWRPERALADIESDLALLAARQEGLRTDIDFTDFLQQLEGLRRELMRHSAGSDGSEAAAQHAQLQEQVTERIETVMGMLEKNL